MRSINDNTTVSDNAAMTIENLYMAISQTKVPSGDMKYAIPLFIVPNRDAMSTYINARTRCPQET